MTRGWKFTLLFFGIAILSGIVFLVSKYILHILPGDIVLAIGVITGVVGFVSALIQIFEFVNKRREKVEQGDDIASIIIQSGANVQINYYEYLDGWPAKDDTFTKQLFNEGREYFHRKEYSLAIEKYIALLDHEKDPASISAIYTQIGHCHFEQRFYIKASEYYAKALIEVKKVNDLEGIASANGNIGVTYLVRLASSGAVRGSNLMRAVGLFNKSAAIFSKDEYPVQYATTQNNLGTAYTDLPSATAEERAENVRKAIQCYQAALEIRKKDEYPQDFCYTASNLGMILLEINDPNGCKYLLEAYTLKEFLPDLGRRLEKLIQEQCNDH